MMPSLMRCFLIPCPASCAKANIQEEQSVLNPQNQYLFPHPSVFYLRIHGIFQVSLQYTVQPIEYTCPFGPLRHPFSLTLQHEHA